MEKVACVEEVVIMSRNFSKQFLTDIYMTVRYFYLWLANISHTAEVWTTYIMVKCGHCFATYQVGPSKNQTLLLGVPELYANHYTVGIGKEKAPSFPVAWYRNLCHCGRSLWKVLRRPNVYLCIYVYVFMYAWVCIHVTKSWRSKWNRKHTSFRKTKTIH